MEPDRGTSEERSSAEEDLFHLAFDSSSDLMTLSRSGDDSVVAANWSFLKAAGRSATDPSEGEPVDLASWAEPGARDRFLEAVTLEGSVRDRRAKVRSTDGDFLELSISADLVSYRGEPCIFAIGRDITDRGRSDEIGSRLAALVDSSQDAITAQDLEGRITAWNTGAEKLYGWSSDEAIGRPVRMIVPPDRIRELGELLKKVAGGTTVGPVQTVRIRRDGRKLDVSLNLSPIFDKSGRVLGISSIAHDVTARLAAEQSLGQREEAYRTLFETSIDAILSCDLDLRIQMANQATLDLLHVQSLEQLIGRSVLEWVGPEDLHRAVQDASRVALEGTVRGMRFRAVREDGTSATVEVNGSLIRGATGEPSGFVAAMRDVSGSVKAEEEMTQALDREMEAVSKLQALDRLRNTFLEAVSHELRTPLTAVLGLAATLKDEEVLTAGERSEFLDRLLKAAKKLERLLVDLLDIDRLESGILEPALFPEDLAEIVDSVVSDFEIGDRVLITELESVRVMLDRVKIERIVENLIANAVRHTSVGTTIWVKARSEDPDAIITVEDDDGSLSPIEMEQIFEPFAHGSLRQSHSPGLGIGLSLVAGFAELHGGRAWAETREEGGLRFCVSIPLHQSIALP